MATAKVPADVAVSPETGKPLTLDTDTHRFRDAAGNEFTADELARCRPANRIRKWLRENYARKS